VTCGARLTETKVAPAVETPAKSPQAPQGEVTSTIRKPRASGLRSIANRPSEALFYSDSASVTSSASDSALGPATRIPNMGTRPGSPCWLGPTLRIGASDFVRCTQAKPASVMRNDTARTEACSQV
jgi:hypothetical protein